MHGMSSARQWTNIMKHSTSLQAAFVLFLARGQWMSTGPTVSRVSEFRTMERDLLICRRFRYMYTPYMEKIPLTLYPVICIHYFNQWFSRFSEERHGCPLCHSQKRQEGDCPLVPMVPASLPEPYLCCGQIWTCQVFCRKSWTGSKIV